MASAGSGATGKTIFCNSGFEAVEAALKTAMLATNRPGIVAFEGAYHGLGYGALNATHRDHFRAPFAAQMGGFARFADFPATAKQMKVAVADVRGFAGRGRHRGGAGGTRAGARRDQHPAARFLRGCDGGREHGALLIVDEIYTGFGRTGRWFACEHSGVAPDLICLGKALTGGFPLSACVGRADVMDAAWPVSGGEAIHTSTFLGHPVGCAMALAQIGEIRGQQLVPRSAQLGDFLLRTLRAELRSERFELGIRGLGLMAGVELRLPDGVPATRRRCRRIKEMLRAGFILLPEGAHANVLSFTPPLTITRAQLTRSRRWGTCWRAILK